MADVALPPIQPYHPTTFRERGVLVPFTTPWLGGTRVRPVARQGLELLVPNPSGRPGVYVMGWNSVPTLCQPTLHDRRLGERLAAECHITPGIMRRIARAIAAEGLAGEDAMQAACTAAETDRQTRTVINFVLLMALVAQDPGVAQVQPATPPPTMETRARLAVTRAATRLGRSPDWIAAALEALADLLIVTGLEGQAGASRVPRTIERLRAAGADFAIWSRTQATPDLAEYADLPHAAAERTIALAEVSLGQARALIGDMAALLRAWDNDPSMIADMISRPEWLLDGWDPICLIWRAAATDADRRTALTEIVPRVPVLPREAADWCGVSPDSLALPHPRRLIRRDREGATVAVSALPATLDLIARNEHIRTVTC